MGNNSEIARDVSEGLEYIREHTELNNILLTGGDPLLLSTGRLEKIISQLREIEHVQIIRIGSKIPAFNPYRILNDTELLKMLEKYSTAEKKIYLMTHFNHPNELTEPAIRALNLMQKAGVVTANQTPLIRGINDDPEVLGELLNKLSYCGVPPYYVFQCRPTQGNKHLAIPIEKAYEIHEHAKTFCSGLAKRSRYTMSHSLGKIEIIGLTEKHVIFKFHRAAHPERKGYIAVYKRNPDAYWFDDYTEKTVDYLLQSINNDEPDLEYEADYSM